MSATKWIKPYKLPKNKPANMQRAQCSLIKTGAGVYLIKRKKFLGDAIVYVGYSGSDVRGVMLRHFQKWIDKRHPDSKRVQRIERVTYWAKGLDWYYFNENFKVRVIYCNTAEQAARIERLLILKYKPEDNTQKLAFESEVENRQAQRELQALEKQVIEVDDLPF